MFNFYFNFMNNSNCISNIKNLIENFIQNNDLSSIKSLNYDLSKYCLYILNGLAVNERDYNKAIEIAKIILILLETHKDISPEVYSNLIFLYCKIKNLDKAIELGKIAIEEKKLESLDLYYNYAIALKENMQYKESIKAFKKAIELNPDFYMAYYQLAEVQYATGDYSEAIRNCEYRFLAHTKLKKFRERFPFPDWNGEEGKKILVFSEQGFGDAIQHARYLPILKSISSHVTLEIQKELYELFLNNPYIDKILPRDFVEKNVPGFEDHDYVISINSLPYWFDSTYELAGIEPYIFPEGKVNFDFSPYKNKLKVGLVFAGSPWHTDDRTRSCFLKEFKSLGNIENVQLFSLQTGKLQRMWTRNNELIWEGTENYDIVNLTEDCEDFIPKIVDLMIEERTFNDTALFLNELDLLISVDTSAVHLAGAMGKKVWLMLPYYCEWRWQKEWYKDVVIFRQKENGNWFEVIERVKNELIKLSNSIVI